MICCSALIAGWKRCVFTDRLHHVSHPSLSSRVPLRHMILLKPVECPSRRRVGYCELRRFDATLFSKFAQSRSLQRCRSYVRLVAVCSNFPQLVDPRDHDILHPQHSQIQVFDSFLSESPCDSSRRSRVTESTHGNCNVQEL